MDIYLIKQSEEDGLINILQKDSEKIEIEPLEILIPTKLGVIMPKEEIEKIIDKISFNKKITAYTLFIQNEIDNLKKKDKEKFNNISQELRDKWQELDSDTKLKYFKMQDREELMFNQKLQIARDYFIDIHKEIVGSAFELFEKEYSNKYSNSAASINEGGRINLKRAWKNLNDEEKEKYKKKVEEIEEMIIEIEKIADNFVPSPYAIYFNESILLAEVTGQKLNKKLVKKRWNKEDNEIINNYIRKYRARKYLFINSRIHGHLNNGIKDKFPEKAVRYFFKDLIIQGKLTGLIQGFRKWKRLTKDEKVIYKLREHREYVYYYLKKFEYSNFKQKSNSLGPKSAFMFFYDHVHQEYNKKIDGFASNLHWALDKWKKISEFEKSKYISIAEQEVRNTKIKEYKFPCQPNTEYALFLKEKWEDIRQEYKNINEKLSDKRIRYFAEFKFKKLKKKALKVYSKQVKDEWRKFKEELIDFNSSSVPRIPTYLNLKPERREEKKLKRARNNFTKLKYKRRKIYKNSGL